MQETRESDQRGIAGQYPSYYKRRLEPSSGMYMSRDGDDDKERQQSNNDYDLYDLKFFEYASSNKYFIVIFSQIHLTIDLDPPSQ